MAQFLYIFVCLFIVFNSATAAHLEVEFNSTIKITVGTTAGCTDTWRFITYDLAETYETYKDILEVEFVPWGRTTYLENGTMVCQFGLRDCFANRVHRCALNMLSGNQDAQVAYMRCEFAPPNPAFLGSSYYCAHVAGLHLVNLDYCVTTTGGPLDLAAEEAAREPMRIINFVPSIHFNDIIDVDLHLQAFRRLKSLICFALADHESIGCQI